MNYRELGKTGLKLSEIGLGCEGFVDADDALSDAIFELALQNGVNCLDMYTPDPAAQKKIGRGIAPVRKDFILQGHLCTQWKNGQYEEFYVDEDDLYKTIIEVFYEKVDYAD